MTINLTFPLEATETSQVPKQTSALGYQSSSSRSHPIVDSKQLLPQVKNPCNNFLWLPHVACKILDPRPGLEPMSSAVEMQSLTMGLPGKSHQESSLMLVSQSVSKSYWHYFKMHPNKDFSGSSKVVSTLCFHFRKQVQSVEGTTTLQAAWHSQK